MSLSIHYLTKTVRQGWSCLTVLFFIAQDSRASLEMTRPVKCIFRFAAETGGPGAEGGVAAYTLL